VAGTAGIVTWPGAIGGAAGIATPLEIGVYGTVGTVTELGAVEGVAGTGGIESDPLLPEGFGASPFGISFSFGISLGGRVVGVVGTTTGAPGVAQGLATGPHSQVFFLQPAALSLSNRLGRQEADPQELQAGAGAQPQDGFGAKRAFNLSRKVAFSHPQDEATVGPQLEHPWAWTIIGGSPHAPAGITSPPAARADDIIRNAAFMREFLLGGLVGTGNRANDLPAS
jgi:hypothetical protein